MVIQLLYCLLFFTKYELYECTNLQCISTYFCFLKSLLFYVIKLFQCISIYFCFLMCDYCSLFAGFSQSYQSFLLNLVSSILFPQSCFLNLVSSTSISTSISISISTSFFNLKYEHSLPEINSEQVVCLF